MSVVQHSSASNEHYTPWPIIAAARTTMGQIDLDPASCEFANRTVKATKFHDGVVTDGLVCDWGDARNGGSNVWLNPPGGTVERSPLWWTSSTANMFLFWSKLVHEWKEGRVRQAVFMGFTLEIFQTSQGSQQWIGDLPFCVPNERIKFMKRVGDGLIEGRAPGHSNVIVYLPPLPLSDPFESRHCRGFYDAFSFLGKVRL